MVRPRSRRPATDVPQGDNARPPDILPRHRREPPLPEWFVKREHLDAVLADALRVRLTTVIAGPGFGKSTLLGAWARDRLHAWYSLDDRDQELATFGGGIASALAAAVPMQKPAVATGRSPREQRLQASAIAAHLADGLEPIARSGELVVVLDDVHHLEPGSGGALLLEALARQLPDRVHLIAASRTPLPFPIERLRAQGQVLSVEGAQLAFSASETEELLGASLGDDARGLADRIHEITAGWPAAVRLAVEMVRRSPVERWLQVLTALPERGSPVFEYLGEEVFSAADRKTRLFLQRACLLDRFTVELCSDIGIRSASVTIDRLRERGLFVQEREPGWLALHALVRRFALENWPLADDERARTLVRTAAWMEERGEAAEALRYLIAARDKTRIARFLERHGGGLVAAGATQVVIDATALVPSDIRGPAIELALGEAYATRGNSDEALACFHRVAAGARVLPVSLAWRMTAAHFSRGDVAAAIDVADRASLTTETTPDEAILLAWAANARHRRGDIGLARSLAERSLRAAAVSGDPRALAHAHNACHRVGRDDLDDTEAGYHINRAIEEAEKAGDLVLLVRARFNRGAWLAERGPYSDALEELSAVIGLTELMGDPNLRAHAQVNRCLALRGLGRLDEALAETEEALAAFSRTGSKEVAYALIERGAIHTLRGKLALARADYEEALRVSEAVGDREGIVPGLAHQAKVVAPEDPRLATELVERAVAMGPGVHYTWALNPAGWVALARGDRERAGELAAESLRVARRWRKPNDIAEALEIQAFATSDEGRRKALLEEALMLWRDVGNPVEEAQTQLALAQLIPSALSSVHADRIERRLRALGVRTEPPLAAGVLSLLPHTEAGLRIRALGGFVVLRGGRPVQAAEWQSKKARDLLKILVAHRGRPMPREALIEHLWQDEEPAKLSGRLSVALSTLRSVLDPGRIPGADSLIIADRDHVRLATGTVPIDLEEFMSLAESGLALIHSGREAEGIDLLEVADAQYAGDFLEEDAYEDWAAPVREEARGLSIRVARELAKAAALRGDVGGATSYLLRILERDPYDEEAHLSLASTLDRFGGHGEARRAYGRYVARMQELGVEPASFPSTGSSG